EGLLLTVRRNGSQYGALESMITVAHSSFYSYLAPGSSYTSSNTEDVDGTIQMQTYLGTDRPATYQEAKTHALHARSGPFPGGDGVVYYPMSAYDSSTVGEFPTSGTDNFVPYKLVDIMAPGGLWAHRSDPQTFADFKHFLGDTHGVNKASPPWGWNDSNDTFEDGTGIPAGRLALDPARVVSAYFGNKGVFGLSYTRMPYQEP
ncbi:hypothetical protein ACWCQZ_51200, partial [Streptomyces sp. NPDC002285]